MNLITVEWRRKLKACYTDDQLHELLGDGKTVIEVLELPIPDAHKVWAVSQWLPEKPLRAFLADMLRRCFARVRKAGRTVDPRSEAILTALEQDRWPTKQERDAATDAAWAATDAVWDATDAVWNARAAAWAAADAAWNARAAAWAAADAAWNARAAAWDAADAAWNARAAADAADAEYAEQVKCLRRLVAEVEKSAASYERRARTLPGVRR